MLKTEQIQVRVTPEDKQHAKELFGRYGLTTSAAINLFIKRSLLENRLPFNLDEEPETNSNRVFNQ